MSMNNHLHRDLLPAPINSTASHGDAHAPPSDNISANAKPKRAQISVACEVCRRRKAKCDGHRPACAPCKARGLDCRYGADPDTTRMMTLKRKYQAVSERNHELENLLGLLRDGSISEAKSLLDKLRAGVDITQLVHLVRQGSISPDYSGFPTPASDVMTMDDLKTLHQYAYHDFNRRNSSSSIRDRMAVNALLVGSSESGQTAPPTLTNSSEFHDSRLHQERLKIQAQAWTDYVDAALMGADLTKWTTVIGDNDLLVHLISLFIAWGSPTTLWLSKAFLADLKAHRMDYCSSMLVNAILSFASHTSPRLNDRNARENPSNLANKFRIEAWRQLNTSKEVINVCTLQTALLLTVIMNLDGLSTTAMELTAEVEHMVSELDLFNDDDRSSEAVGEGVTSETIVRRCTLWSVYNYITFQKYAARKPTPYSDAPAKTLLMEIDLQPVQEESATNKSPGEAPMEAHSALVFQAYSGIQIIQARITLAKFRGDASYTILTAASLYNELLGWAASLPEAMQPSILPSPHALALHMICHSMIIDLFYPFKDITAVVPIHQPSTSRTSALPAPSSTPLAPSPSQSPSKDRFAPISVIAALSREQIYEGLNMYRSSFGFAKGPIILFQTMFISRVDLRRQLDDDKAVEMMSNVVRAMRDLSESFWIEKKVLKDVASLVEAEQDKLPEDVRQCLFDWDDDDSADESQERRERIWDLQGRISAMEEGLRGMTVDKQ
ncbi:hypothetical protein B9Z65_2002 [Elsinoe australis]|uniref:Zn(2)-C6 fungal-type domain-containing protein n=1 Tax=Elsinoe australis TaxID=40998 RepID=A0A2P7YMR4_9PEZI|nr:hypothetical protein B9Z65_2002 [Elsinoe australis]